MSIDKEKAAIAARFSDLSPKILNFLIKAKKAGFKIEEVAVTHHPRKKGAGTGRKLNVIVNSFVDLMKLWKKLR